MTTLLVRVRVRQKRREDGIVELVRRSDVDVAASELAQLGALCAGAGLLCGPLGHAGSLAAAGAVLATYLVARARIRPGRMVAMHAAADAGPMRWWAAQARALRELATSARARPELL